MAKKTEGKQGKSITYQTKDEHEKALYEYSESLHNFSGTMKRLIANSDGFKEWQQRKRQQAQAQPQRVVTSQGSGGIKIKIGG